GGGGGGDPRPPAPRRPPLARGLRRGGALGAGPPATRARSIGARILRARRDRAQRLARPPHRLAWTPLHQGRRRSELPVAAAKWIAVRRNARLRGSGDRETREAVARRGDRSLRTIPPHRALLRVFLQGTQCRRGRVEVAITGNFQLPTPNLQVDQLGSWKLEVGSCHPSVPVSAERRRFARTHVDVERDRLIAAPLHF